MAAQTMYLMHKAGAWHTDSEPVFLSVCIWLDPKALKLSIILLHKQCIWNTKLGPDTSNFRSFITQVDRQMERQIASVSRVSMTLTLELQGVIILEGPSIYMLQNKR